MLARAAASLWLGRFGVPDLDVVEEAVLAGDAEFDLGLGLVADAWGFEETGGLAVDGRAHFVADGLDDEGVPFASFKFDGKAGAVRGEQFADGVFVRGDVFLQLDEGVALAAVAFVEHHHLVEPHLGAAEVAVVGALEFAVVKLDINHRGTLELDADLDDAVLRGEVEAKDRGVGGDGGFAVGGGDVLVARLRAFERAVFDGKGRDDFVPDLGGLGALEVIGEKEFLLFGDGLGRDGGRVRGKGGGGDEAGKGEVGADVHEGLGHGVRTALCHESG